jgi:hypothetical protein
MRAPDRHSAGGPDSDGQSAVAAPSHAATSDKSDLVDTAQRAAVDGAGHMQKAGRGINSGRPSYVGKETGADWRSDEGPAAIGRGRLDRGIDVDQAATAGQGSAQRGMAEGARLSRTTGDMTG